MCRDLCCDCVLNHHPLDDYCDVTRLEEKVYLHLAFLCGVQLHRADLPLIHTDEVRPRWVPAILLLACPHGLNDNMALRPSHEILV